MTNAIPADRVVNGDPAEQQIREHQRIVDYQVHEYPIEVIVEKHLTGEEEGQNEIFVPDYQRELIWDDKQQSKFIESLIIGLPIPYIFVADVMDEDEALSGRLEIVDGTQRIRTLARFLNNDLVLTDLPKLTRLEGFRFRDLALSRQRRFLRTTLRMIELTERADEETRRDIFDRINTGAADLVDMEKRRGIIPGPFIELTEKLSRDGRFEKLAPISPALAKRRERQELVSRFFAYLDRYQTFGGPDAGKVVGQFIYSYTEDMNRLLKEEGSGGPKSTKMMEEWDRTLAFIEKYFPNGFRKKPASKSTPRVRFEAIGVGVGLALRERPDLVPADVSVWIDDQRFRNLTTSDASNNRGRVAGRIEFVRDRLLGK